MSLRKSLLPNPIVGFLVYAVRDRRIGIEGYGHSEAEQGDRLNTMPPLKSFASARNRRS
jgi:hypothetical protein